MDQYQLVGDKVIFCNAERGVLTGETPVTLPAQRTVIEVLIRHGMPIPRPSRQGRGERLIELDGLVAAKAALYLALWNRGDGIEISGDDSLLDRWRQAMRVRWS